MQLRSVASYFNTIPLYQWANGRFSSLGIKGSVSMFEGGMGEKSVDLGARKLVTDEPVPAACTVLRLGGVGCPIYLIGYRDEGVGSADHEEPFSYLIHTAHEVTQVYRATKTTSASGVAGSIVWNPVQTTWGNDTFVDTPDNRLLADTVFVKYNFMLPSDCVANTEDELRTSKHVYVIKSIFQFNDLNVAVCSRKGAQV